MTDQIRRSSRSIGAQIAEAWAKRDYEKHFVSKLTDADAEQMETQHWVDIASDCGYLPEEQLHDLKAKCSEIGCLIGSIKAKSDLFCNPQNRRISELRTDYFDELKAMETEY